MVWSRDQEPLFGGIDGDLFKFSTETGKSNSLSLPSVPDASVQAAAVHRAAGLADCVNTPWVKRGECVHSDAHDKLVAQFAVH